MTGLVIDFHAHVLERQVFERSWMHNVASGFGKNGPAKPGSRQDQLHHKLLDPTLHLEDMDRFGIDVSVLSHSTVIAGGQWAGPRTDLELNQRANDHIAELVRAHPSRFVGSFSLPLQDLALSLKEAERCSEELNFGVLNLPAAARGAYLGDPRYLPLWELVASQHLIAFIHPDGVTDPWFQQYSLWNSIGQTIEEAKVMSSLIYEGVLERWPDLRIVMAHGGGYLPHYYGRLDRNFTNRPETAQNITAKPSTYLPRFYYDTCVYVPHVLEELVDLVGPGRIVLGSDWPMGGTDPVAFVGQARNVGAEEAAQIKGENAAALLEEAGVLPGRVKPATSAADVPTRGGGCEAKGLASS
jgi:aminocarboxymuconate-semialdehyde decarboxylase